MIACIFVSLAVTARASSDADSTRSTGAFVSPLSHGLLLSNRTTRDSRDTPTPNALTFSLSPFTIQSYAPESTLDAMLFGAGAGSTFGMFLGAIGNTLGWFDEDTTWIITGAAAAAGAIYSTKHFKVRASLGPDEWTPRPPDDR